MALLLNRVQTDDQNVLRIYENVSLKLITTFIFKPYNTKYKSGVTLYIFPHTKNLYGTYDQEIL